MPSYNCEKFIKTAIESVVNQTYKDFELIIVDDCSTDGTKEIIKGYVNNDKRIKLICQMKNMGVANARNRGIDEAKGDYTAFLDSDDVWRKNKLEEQLAFMEKEKADIVYSSYDFIDEKGNKILKPFIVPEKTDFNKMLSENVFAPSTVMLKTGLIKKNKFNPEFYHEDYVLWMGLMKMNCRAAGDKKVLADYRIVEGSRSRNKINAVKQRWKIYRKNLKLNIIRSSVSFIKYAFNGIKKYYT